MHSKSGKYRGVGRTQDLGSDAGSCHAVTTGTGCCLKGGRRRAVPWSPLPPAGGGTGPQGSGTRRWSTRTPPMEQAWNGYTHTRLVQVFFSPSALVQYLYVNELSNMANAQYIYLNIVFTPSTWLSHNLAVILIFNLYTWPSYSPLHLASHNLAVILFFILYTWTSYSPPPPGFPMTWQSYFSKIFLQLQLFTYKK